MFRNVDIACNIRALTNYEVSPGLGIQGILFREPVLVLVWIVQPLQALKNNNSCCAHSDGMSSW